MDPHPVCVANGDSTVRRGKDPVWFVKCDGNVRHISKCTRELGLFWRFLQARQMHTIVHSKIIPNILYEVQNKLKALLRVCCLAESFTR